MNTGKSICIVGLAIASVLSCNFGQVKDGAIWGILAILVLLFCE